jgi:hypothetical protein
LSKGLRLALAGLILAALAVGLGRWRERAAMQRRLRHEAWFGYLQGPLSDLLEGESRGRELLRASLLRPLDAGQRRSLEDAAHAVVRAADAAGNSGAAWNRAAEFGPLREALPLHRELAAAAQGWVAVSAVPARVREALKKDPVLRQALAEALSRQRRQLGTGAPWTQDDLLEANALIYSLNEAAP